MGRGRSWVEWGAAIFTLNLAWEVCIYLAQAWPIYHPFIGMAVGGVMVAIGLVLCLIGGLRHAEPDGVRGK